MSFSSKTILGLWRKSAPADRGVQSWLLASRGRPDSYASGQLCRYIEGVLEESMGEGIGDYQGGSIDIKDIGELDAMKKGLHQMHRTLE